MAIKVLYCSFVSELKIIVVSDSDPVLGLILIPDTSLSLFVNDVCINQSVESLHGLGCITNFFGSMSHPDFQLNL